ncbi:MAG: hypothetical protein LUC98_01725 [Lachnospiraceae bacterium]|nr:hypothetical protein [Lachnospiraceae bacterium]
MLTLEKLSTLENLTDLGEKQEQDLDKVKDVLDSVETDDLEFEEDDLNGEEELDDLNEEEELDDLNGEDDLEDLDEEEELDDLNGEDDLEDLDEEEELDDLDEEDDLDDLDEEDDFDEGGAILREDALDDQSDVPTGTREYNEFEKKVLEEHPEYREYYETGKFYRQGINEFGYLGTCGPTTMANTMNLLLGTNDMTENKVLKVAVENGLCVTNGDVYSNGGTTALSYLTLYEEMNKRTGNQLKVEPHIGSEALTEEEVASHLERGDVINVAVNANILWDMKPENARSLFLGRSQNKIQFNHWITVSGVRRSKQGWIEGFDIIDSGGGRRYVTVDKYNSMCFGWGNKPLKSPLSIVVSKK